MRLTSLPRFPVLSREDKETNLKQFLAEALAARRAGTGEAFGDAFSLVARAADSPVAKAMLAMSAEIAASNIAVRVVLFENEVLSEDSIQPSLLDVGSIEVRMLNDQRFASAHEQLSLGYGKVWIGDCMRRDPAKRDAFEMYHADQPTIAAHADASFAKLWEKSVALNRMLHAPVAADVLLAGHPATSEAPVTSRR
jgi:hypothetical protein